MVELVDDVVSPRADLGDLVVASVPSSHVYVRHIGSETPDGIVRLPDPDPESPARSTQQRWWPPAMLDPRWVADHDFDVMHIQFGFDAWTPADLRAVLDAVHATRRPVVYTAHDLRNPHHATRELHDQQLEVLVGESDQVLTLTRGAADAVEERYGRRPLVVPHPHVVDFSTMARVAARRGAASGASEFRVGLHLKSLRPNMDPSAILPTLVEAVRGIPGGVLQVNGHRDVLDPDGARLVTPLANYLQEAAGRGDVELHVHDFMSDHELWTYLAALDVSVLPYRFGTHSGWLEACLDLGTSVAAPSCGFYAGQGSVHVYDMDEYRFDAESLRGAVVAAYEQGRPTPYTVSWRRQQRADIARRHAAMYRALV